MGELYGDPVHFEYFCLKCLDCGEELVENSHDKYSNKASTQARENAKVNMLDWIYKKFLGFVDVELTLGIPMSTMKTWYDRKLTGSEFAVLTMIRTAPEVVKKIHDMHYYMRNEVWKL